ncbi:Cytosolic sulfotransferase 13 [Abeliophyllum distichum]|uniref:Sulfotransferase n=1 Tax=Abeliophyllum distichum TaxID=126358 RepID=A0ABD1QL42_9LAMI
MSTEETNRKYEEIYKRTWFNPNVIKGVMLAKDHFLALPIEIFLTTFQKCGTTWLKALTFTIMNRKLYDFSKHPLLTRKSPRMLSIFGSSHCSQRMRNHSLTCPLQSSPRVFSIHSPYPHLPESVRASPMQ